jgi:hypothetical protein
LEKVVCVNCGKEIGGVEDVLGDDAKVLACDLCGKPVCGDCAKHLSMYVLEGEVRRLRSLRLCPSCAPKSRKLYKDV